MEMGSERDVQARPQAGVKGLHLRAEGERECVQFGAS